MGEQLSDCLVPVKVSLKSMRLAFHGCDVDYIHNVCGGACCRSKAIAILEHERAFFEEEGCVLEGDVLVADRRGLCPFFKLDGLCELHNTEHKPFGCRVSPFTFNKNGTLLVQRRYVSLRCYRKKTSTMPYDVKSWACYKYRDSLELLFGESLTANIIAEASELPFKNALLETVMSKEKFAWCEKLNEMRAPFAGAKREVRRDEQDNMWI